MQPSSSEEVRWQEQVARTFDYFEGVCATAAEYSLGIVRRHLVGKRILEVGPANGYMTRGLFNDFDLTLVEPSETLCQKLRQCFPQAQVKNTLVEDFARPNVSTASFCAIFWTMFAIQSRSCV